MRTTLVSFGLAAALAGGFAFAGDQAGPKSADAIVAQYKALQPPARDDSRKDDPAYRKEYSERYMAMLDKKAELAKQLWEVDPNHPEAIAMMNARWQRLVQTGKHDTALGEIDAIVPTLSGEARDDLEFTRARIAVSRLHRIDDQLVAADEYIRAHPGNPRGGDLLASIAARTLDMGPAHDIYRRIATEFPTSKSAKAAQAKLRQVDAIGKPFDLSFTDATTGKTVSMADLKGKVVVIDFWATWCGPCVAEMPHMKEIYAKYKDKGVEFIGVSLDNPEESGKGLTKLKEFVARENIPWPQYYQGKGGQSEFSSGWGITAIPWLFVVDQNGNLYSTNARGQVEKIIEKLLTGTTSTNG